MHHVSARLSLNVREKCEKHGGEVEGQKSSSHSVFTLATAKRLVFVPLFRETIGVS